MFEPVPSKYYVSVISDHWSHAETHPSISFKHLIRPKKIFKQTSPLDLQLQTFPLLARHKEFEAPYVNSIQMFNKIQMQVFQMPYTEGKRVADKVWRALGQKAHRESDGRDERESAAAREARCRLHAYAGMRFGLLTVGVWCCF